MFKLIRKEELLTREEFKTQVLKRDNQKCVFCQSPATTVQHIYERKLFWDGCYCLDNGASVCDRHHFQCDRTDISVEELWIACEIKNKILPIGYDPSKSYDRWGNLIFEDGKRSPGALFKKENVQQILKDKIHLFTF